MRVTVRARSLLLAILFVLGAAALPGCKKSGGDPKDVEASEQQLQPIPESPGGESAIPPAGAGGSTEGAPELQPLPPGGGAAPAPAAPE